ncbi:MAG: ParB/RepB/Spo0J family partition protein [Pseudomonadota bacterium]
MANKRKSLGRGLGALLGDAAKAQVSGEQNNLAGETPATVTSGGEVSELPVDLLQRGRYQPRVDMRHDSLDELAASIQAQGVVQPLAVRPITTGGGEQRYEIIAGERRWRAAQKAGLQTVPVIVHAVDDRQAVAMALIENIQREDLNAMEEARALSRLIDEFDLTHQEGADAVGRSRASVSNLLRLMELGEDVQQMLEARKLDMGHARALLGIPAGRAQTALAREVAARKLSVRETEKRVRLINNPPPKTTKTPTRDPNIVTLEQELQQLLGAPVALKQSGNGAGQLNISYASLDELDGILEKLRK